MSRLVKRRVANPVPSVLAYINGGKKMATKKKRATKGRATVANKPKRRPGKSASVRSHSGRAQKSNSPSTRPKGRGRGKRNPFSAGVITEGAKLAGSGIAIGFAQPFVRSLIGVWVGNSIWASAGITLATGYGLSWVSKLTSFTRNFQRPLELATWTIVATQLASSFVLPLLRPGGAPANPTMGRFGSRRMGDLVTLPAGNYDPYYGTTPQIAGSTVTAPAATGGSQAAKLKGLITMNPMRNGASYYQNYGR